MLVWIRLNNFEYEFNYNKMLSLSKCKRLKTICSRIKLKVLLALNYKHFMDLNSFILWNNENIKYIGMWEDKILTPLTEDFNRDLYSSPPQKKQKKTGLLYKDPPLYLRHLCSPAPAKNVSHCLHYILNNLIRLLRTNLSKN